MSSPFNIILITPVDKKMRQNLFNYKIQINDARIIKLGRYNKDNVLQRMRSMN